jgi:hypothetical protein
MTGPAAQLTIPDSHMQHVCVRHSSNRAIMTSGLIIMMSLRLRHL